MLFSVADLALIVLKDEDFNRIPERIGDRRENPYRKNADFDDPKLVQSLKCISAY